MEARKKIIQFNWRKHWKSKVLPHLNNEKVQEALDLGMKLCDSTWQRGDPPFEVGAVGAGPDPCEGTLAWYQPLGRCQFIAPFALEIGRIIYPNLAWSILGSNRHAVAVGRNSDGNPQVVMDILLFAWFSAEQSMEFADPTIPDSEYFEKLKAGQFAKETGDEA